MWVREPTRATITPTRFVNHYDWGSFKGDPLTLVEKYFDVFFYYASWGTHHLMLKIPRRLLDRETAMLYSTGEQFSVHEKDEHLILEFYSEEDPDEEWDEDEGIEPVLE